MRMITKHVLLVLASTILASCTGNSTTKPVSSDASAVTVKNPLTIVFHYDGGGSGYSNPTLPPATKNWGLATTAHPGQERELVSFDITNDDCSLDKKFMVLAIKLPQKGSLSARLKPVNSAYPAGSPREHCNGSPHQQLSFYEIPNATGDDLVVLRAPSNEGFYDVNLKVNIQ